MCTNKREIITKSGRKMFVSCGHCPACLQAKANRNAFKIKMQHDSTGKYITLFVTLVYQNEYIPYILKSDFDKYDGVLPIYRDYDIRKVRVKTPVGLSYDYRERKCGVIDSFVSQVYTSLSTGIRYFTGKYFGSKKQYKTHFDKVGVLYWNDLLDFLKRVRIKYERTYKEKLDLSYFAVGEYGPTTKRPHYHLLMQVPATIEQRLRHIIVESWKYCSKERLQKYIELEKYGGNYLSSYVNSHNYLSSFYFAKEIAPKCSHSQHYGLRHHSFSLSEIKKKVYSHNLSFDVVYSCKGKTISLNTLIPSYVVNYWFPKIKGFSSLTSDELIKIYQYPTKYLARYAYKLNFDTLAPLPDDERTYFDKSSSFSQRFLKLYRYHVFPPSDEELTQFVDDEEKLYPLSDYHKYLNRILRAQERWLELSGFVDTGDIDSLIERDNLLFDFANTCVNAWIVYNSNMLKRSYEQFEDDLFRYENIYEFREKRRLISPSLVDYCHDNDINISQLDTDVNTNKYNVIIDLQLCEKYTKLDKSKKINNTLYSMITEEL